MAIAIYIHFLRRCVVWPSRMRGGDNNVLRLLAPASARRAILRGFSAQPAGGHLPLPPVLHGHTARRGNTGHGKGGDVSVGRFAMDKRLPALIDLMVARKVRFFFTPDGILVVRGHLDLRGSGIDLLPDRLVVAGSLLLTGCPLGQLPDMLSVGEVLDLKDTLITALPPGLAVGGPLFLENTPLRELAAHSHFEDSLDLESTPIAALPSGLKVNGYLNIRGTTIAHLPPDLQLAGPLLLDAHRIRSPLAWRRVTLPSWQPEEGGGRREGRGGRRRPTGHFRRAVGRRDQNFRRRFLRQPGGAGPQWYRRAATAGGAGLPARAVRTGGDLIILISPCENGYTGAYSCLAKVQDVGSVRGGYA